MPTGDAYSSGHLVPSLWDLHEFYLLRPILFRACRYFTGLCSSNIPWYFLDFTFDIIYYLCCMCIDFYDLSAWCGCWFVVYLRRFIYKFLNMCPFDFTAVAGSRKVGPETG